MTKKEYLIKVLEKLGDKWEKGPKLIKLLLENKISDPDIDQLTEIINKHINEIYEETIGNGNID